MTHPPAVLVAGTGTSDPDLDVLAEQVGRGLAQVGAVLLCGGLGGVMEAAARGARAEGGRTVGLLPGHDRGAANPYLDVAVPTGLGELRNGLLVRAANAVIAVGGGYGTLSEIALALEAGLPVIGLHTWQLARDSTPDTGIVRAADPADAVALALQMAGGASGSRAGPD